MTNYRAEPSNDDTFNVVLLALTGKHTICIGLTQSEAETTATRLNHQSLAEWLGTLTGETYDYAVLYANYWLCGGHDPRVPESLGLAGFELRRMVQALSRL